MVADTFLVIGAGSIGTRHADNLKSLGVACELASYRTLDLNAVAQRTDIAGIVIATATPIRLELIEFCAEHQWPFYVEKPLAMTTEQLDAIYTAAEPVAKRSMVGFMMRYHPVVRELAARDLSDIYGFGFTIGHDVRQWRTNWSFAESYASSPNGGGVLLDLCHELDIVNCLFPKASVISATSADHPDYQGVDFATMVAMAAPLGTVQMDYLSPVSNRTASLHGTDAVIDIDLLAPSITIRDGLTESTEQFEFTRNDMFLGAMADFVALACGQSVSDNPLLPRFDQVRPSCELIANAWQARRFTGEVDVDFS